MSTKHHEVSGLRLPPGDAAYQWDPMHLILYPHLFQIDCALGENFEMAGEADTGYPEGVCAEG